jgi:hypothetical protein
MGKFEATSIAARIEGRHGPMDDWIRLALERPAITNGQRPMNGECRASTQHGAKTNVPWKRAMHRGNSISSQL